jgi:hypothetical protein
VDDGCGGIINCGTCSDPLSCGAAPGRPNLCGCVPNQFLCSPTNELRQCSPDGSTSFLVAQCPDGACNAASAKCDTCIPGTKYCSGKQLFTCNGDGTSGTPGTQCLASQICDPTGTGECDICVASGFFCVGSNLRQCNELGKGSSLKDTCGNDNLCARGVFLGKCPTPVCQPGERRCSGAAAQICNAQQDGWDTVETCATAALCGKTKKGICDAPACQPGETSCVGNSQKLCNADQTDFNLIPCALPTPVCENGACAARGPQMVLVRSSSTSMRPR